MYSALWFLAWLLALCLTSQRAPTGPFSTLFDHCNSLRRHPGLIFLTHLSDLHGRSFCVSNVAKTSRTPQTASPPAFGLKVMSYAKPPVPCLPNKRFRAAKVSRLCF